MQDEESSNICVGTLIIWVSPKWDVMIPSLDPLDVVLSNLYQLYDLPSKSPITTDICGFLLKINSRLNSGLLTDVSDYSIFFWLEDLYKQIRSSNLPLIVISKSMLSWSREIPSIYTGKEDLK